MKAYVLEGINHLVYKEIKMPALPQNWALVKVKAAGICSSDIARIFKKGTYHFPTVPGHEFSGIVMEVNSSNNNNNLLGSHVGVFPLIPCKECEQCKKHSYELCRRYDYIGSRRDGGFAEYVAVPIWNLIPLNTNISFEEAAMLEPLSVALHAIKRASIQAEDSVGIIGTGMIGFAAAQWALKERAKTVTIIGRSESKKKISQLLGVNYDTVSNNSQLYSVILEAVGSEKSIEFALQSLKPGGKLILMGNPEGDIQIKQDVYWRILRNQLTIFGTWNSSYEYNAKSDWTEAANALEHHEIDAIHLISHLFDQKDLSRALDVMLKHSEPYCKIMTIWNKE